MTAGGAVLVCPGNQQHTPPEQKCPYAAKCPLIRALKAPEGRLCPIERSLTEDRFSSWAFEFGKDPDDLNESERATISQLTYIDLQEQRSTNILATGEAARLTQTNVTEAVHFVHQNDQGEQIPEVLPLTWERVLHINAMLLDQLGASRIKVLKEWMLTPEQKWKMAKAERKDSAIRGGQKMTVTIHHESYPGVWQGCPGPARAAPVRSILLLDKLCLM